MLWIRSSAQRDRQAVAAAYPGVTFSWSFALGI